MQHKTDTPINLGKMIKKFLIQDKIQKINTKIINITGISTDTQKQFDKVFKFSEFLLKQRKNEAILFNDGLSLGYALVINNKIYCDFDELMFFKKIGDKVIEAHIWGSDLITINNVPHKQILKFYYENGKAILDYLWHPDLNNKIMNYGYDKVIEYGEDKKYIFKSNELPITIFPNNSAMLGDIEHFGTSELIEEISRQSNWNGEEWNLVKNNLLIDKLANSDYDETKWKKQFSKSNVISLTSPDGQIVNVAYPLPTDKSTLLQQHINLNWLIDKLEKYMFRLRDTTATGTNKMNGEIMMYNQYALEYLISTVELRNYYYTEYINKILNLLVSLGLAKTSKNKVVAKISMSAIEKIKLDTLQAQAKNLQTKNETVANKQLPPTKGSKNNNVPNN